VWQRKAELSTLTIFPQETTGNHLPENVAHTCHFITPDEVRERQESNVYFTTREIIKNLPEPLSSVEETDEDDKEYFFGSIEGIRKRDRSKEHTEKLNRVYSKMGEFREQEAHRRLQEHQQSQQQNLLQPRQSQSALQEPEQ
jgi:hypothetical protein